MNQGVLVSIAPVPKEDPQRACPQDDGGTSIVDFLKEINILKVSKIIAASWDEIKPKILRLSWRKILPLEDEEDSQGSEEPDGDPSAAEFHSYFQMIGQNVDEREINEWLQADTSDMGYEHLSDAEIIAEAISLPITDAVCSNDETETVAMDSSSSSSSSSSLLQSLMEMP